MADPQFQQALEKANSLVAEGKLDEGAALYEQLIAHDPHNLELYRALALVYERKGDIPKAISTHLRWAAVCAQLGLNDEALKLYTGVLALETTATNPEKKGLFKSSSTTPDKVRELVASARPEISLYIGHIYLSKNLADEAIKYLKGALDSSTGAQDDRVHTLLGIAYMQKGMDKEAIGEFQEVVRLAPNDAAYAYEKLGEIYRRTRPTASSVWYRNAGDLYLRNEQYQEAVRAYEVILQSEPRNKDVLSRLAEIYTQLGMSDQALTTYRTLATIYTEEGLLDKVIILYEKLTEVNPGDDESWLRLLEIYRGILQRDASNLSVRSKLIKHLLSRDDKQGAIPEYIALAQAYLEKGVLDEASQVLAKTLELAPENARAIEMIGDVHLRRDERDQALPRYLEALKLSSEANDEAHRHGLSQKLTELFPEESGVQYELARTLKDQGSFDQALSEILKVLEQDPNHVQAMSEASELYLQMGRGEEARSLYRRIIELEPERADIRLKLFEQTLGAGDVEGARTQVDDLAAALREAGMTREAELVYRRMQGYLPDDPEIRLQICALRLAAGDAESVLREHLLLANMFMRQQLVERAAEMYATILSLHPDNLTVHHHLGRVRALQGKTAEALGHLAHLAQVYIERNLVDQAIVVLRESVEIAPALAELRQRLIELLVRASRLDETVEHFKKLFRSRLEAGADDLAAAAVRESLALHPSSIDLRLDLATAYLEFNHLEAGQAMLEDLVAACQAQGDSAKAIDIYDKMAHVYRAQARNDLYWQVRQRTAELYVQEGRSAEALGEMLEIVEASLREDDVERARSLFSPLVDLYVSEQRLDEGVRAAGQLVDGLARDGRAAQAEAAQDLLLQLLERAGDRGRTVELLRQLAARAQEAGDLALALSLQGRLYDLLMASGEVEEAASAQLIRIENALAANDLDAARALYETLRSVRHDDARDATRYVEALCARGYDAEAVPLLSRVMEQRPDDAETGVRLALLAARSGDMATAARWTRTFLASGVLDRILVEISTSEPAGEGERALRFGDLYRELGFYEEALDQYQVALRQRATVLRGRNGMAMLFHHAGYGDLALRQLTRTLELPGFDDEEMLETRFNLATLHYGEGRFEQALAMYNECAAVRLRYRNVAERIQELNGLISRGSEGREDEPVASAATPEATLSPAVDAGLAGAVAATLSSAPLDLEKDECVEKPPTFADDEFADAPPSTPDHVLSEAPPSLEGEAVVEAPSSLDEANDGPVFEGFSLPVDEMPTVEEWAPVLPSSQEATEEAVSVETMPIADDRLSAPSEQSDPVEATADPEALEAPTPASPPSPVSFAEEGPAVEIELAPSLDPAMLMALDPSAHVPVSTPPLAAPAATEDDDDFFLEGPPPDPTKA